MSGPVETISAVTLLTADMAPAVAFYDALGFELLYGGPTASFSSFAVGIRDTSTCNSIPGRATGLADLGPRDLLGRRRRRRLCPRGASTGYAPETEPADAPWGERYFHVRDPDGHELSFARPLSSSR